MCVQLLLLLLCRRRVVVESHWWVVLVSKWQAGLREVIVQTQMDTGSS